MNARLIKLWLDLQGSYYFIPSIMALAAIGLAFATSQIDRLLDYDSIQALSWFYSTSAEGARNILATIAGSMITVAGVTFSMTMVAVTTASGQFGPRLIGNFMRDKANQFTLGTFTSTFVYCLLMMRVTRVGENLGSDNSVAEVVPNISLFVALLMTLASVGVFIYFIHHIPETLNVGNITSRVGRQLRRGIDDLFPHAVGESGSDLTPDIDISNLNYDDAIEVTSNAEGYIQALNTERLLDVATKHDLLIQIQYRPGDFYTKGSALVHAWSKQGKDIPEATLHKINSSFAMGEERTAHQNVLFLADILVEILARALSPGINDPFTAVNCMNWFHSAFRRICAGTPPSPYRFDAEGALRVIARPFTFERLAGVIIDQSRPYVAADRNATIYMLGILTELIAESKHEDYTTILHKKMDALFNASQEQLPSTQDKNDVRTHYDLAVRLISNPDLYHAQRMSAEWIGGRA